MHLPICLFEQNIRINRIKCRKGDRTKKFEICIEIQTNKYLNSFCMAGARHLHQSMLKNCSTCRSPTMQPSFVQKRSSMECTMYVLHRKQNITIFLLHSLTLCSFICFFCMCTVLFLNACFSCLFFFCNFLFLIFRLLQFSSSESYLNRAPKPLQK